MRLRSTFPLGRLFGIRIEAHVSWLLILLLITFTLASALGDGSLGALGPLRWPVAFGTALLFFASVVVHELAHSLTARNFGIPVKSITLFLFGGVSQLEKDSRRPGEELAIAIAGPLMSFVVAAGFFSARLILGPGSVAAAIASQLGLVNALLGIFNLLPGFPLDGGRVLRGLVWWLTGDPARATRVAAGSGRLIATMMIVLGVLRFFGGDQLGGMWFAFLGWFLLDAARFSTRQLELKSALDGVTAGQIMSGECPMVEGSLGLDRLADEQVLPTGQRCFLVGEPGAVEGLITIHDLRAVPRERWPSLTVREAMRPLSALRTVAPDTPAEAVVETMAREDLNQLPVMEGGRLRGIVTREHIVRLLAARAELGR